MNEIRLLTSADAAAFWAIRREALENAPRAFSSSVQEHLATTVEETAPRLDPKPDGDFVVGGFVDGALSGTAGFHREDRPKTQHKGIVWGVYVKPGARGRGLARAVMTTLIERARTCRGLEQVNLHVVSDQTAARTLYLSLGFEIVGHTPRALKIDGQYADWDQMILWL